MILKIIFLFFATILAFWISAICGGGASLILIPILNLFLPSSFIPFSITIGTLTSSASRVVVFKKHIYWKVFIWFVPFSIPAVLLGGWLMKYINPLYLQVIVGLLLLANVPELFKSKREQKEEEKPYPNFILAFVGFFAGFISGITGAIGLLFNRFYLRYGLTKEEIVATRAANEIFLHSIKLFIYLLFGLYSENALLLGIVIAIAAIVSSYSVKFILPYLSEYLFRKIGYGAMVISGLFLLISTSQNIIQKENVSVIKNQHNETTMNWRNSSFVLEFAIDEGFEIERQIQPNELPPEYKSKYDQLINQYDQVFLEIVYRIGSNVSYEFYCYKNNELTKIEFK
ncbi:sulfite exporter TauE/SafE family protein [Leptospira perdikensis]|uniref:Probable membrane transporter protein n=1 Tax=Leptospira perdikensis TaxID=2484948 RepID=A0A4R9JI86_9LEPT|nr:sulfite exporter TauE/SafE family protein [Leptospira perdikensis]TGL44623.1 sulfite exporter TauE/SafE family protein [Leptospira perdikensis]